ncbi:hypothetical protein O181_016793 [Austropuccinia psidii MF-1]|uniref:Retrotransposon gag domain-containing protein n=1 Tax=Austropuccinia psidii MF-1 TaxID=1389203 RepID=A0A9Q3C529_9BASI|nr:hypothetical protein [Austropuccinia psidii MF-1]
MILILTSSFTIESPQTRSQPRAQAVPTPTPRAPLDGTPEVPQLKTHSDRGPNLEGGAPSRKEGRGPRRSSSFSEIVGGFPALSTSIFQGLGEDGEEEENSVEEEEADGAEGVPAPVGASQGTGGPAISQSNQPVSYQSEPYLLAIIQKMTQIMASLQAALSSEALRPLAFKNPSMNAPEFFDRNQPFKVRCFIQSFKLIFNNDLANFPQERNKVLYATSFLIERAAKWIETYPFNITSNNLNYFFDSWTLFESQIFTLFGDPNEFRNAEVDLDSLRMKEGEHVLLYIADFQILVSRIGDWGERAVIHHFRKGLVSRILDQLSSHTSRIDSFRDLMDITLERDTRYHERQKEMGHFEEKKPEPSKSISSHPKNSSSSNKRKFLRRGTSPILL